MSKINWDKLITKEDKFEQMRQSKINEIGSAFNNHVTGSFVCSLGFPMQFNETDALKMEGAIQLLQATNSEFGYLTDANNETHYDISLLNIQRVKVEMLQEFAKAHAKKQELRSRITIATTKEELDEVQWEQYE